METKITIKECYKQLYVNKLDKLDKMKIFSERHKLFKHTHIYAYCIKTSENKTQWERAYSWRRTNTHYRVANISMQYIQLLIRNLAS